MHYSFDFTQQVHFPNDPLQPSPIYFLTSRKCGIFGVCCEGLPQRVNYLIDEGMATLKRRDAVLSYLHHFFLKYRLREEELQLRQLLRAEQEPVCTKHVDGCSVIQCIVKVWVGGEVDFSCLPAHKNNYL